MLKRFAEWVLREDERAVPRRIDPLDSLVVIYTGDQPPKAKADEFELAVAKWRLSSDTVLYMPSGFRLMATRRGPHVARDLRRVARANHAKAARAALRLRIAAWLRKLAHR